MTNTDKIIREFEEKFVGDNWKYGIGYLAWEEIKPFLKQKLDQAYQKGKE